jgi:uncharacterized protein YdaU (DUF1376 family)
MPLWIGAYLADTQHLSRDEHGAYFLMMMAYWRNKGPLPDDAKRLASIVKATPAEWKKLSPTLSEFFTVSNGVWAHKRIDVELAAAGDRSKKAADKAKAAAEARWGTSTRTITSNAPSMPQAFHEDMQKDMHDDCPTPSPTPIGIHTDVVLNKSVGIPAHTPVDNFLETVKTKRPDLDAVRFLAKFRSHYPPEKQTIERLLDWLESEGRTPGGTQVVTVPSKPGKDPELLRLEQEAQQPRSGPPPDLKSKFAELRKASGIPIRGATA